MKVNFMILLVFFFQLFYSQQKETYLESKIIFKEKNKLSQKIDSSIIANKDGFSRSITEGSSTNYNKNHKQTGSGGFSVYTIRNKSNNKLIKIDYSSTLHIDKPFKNSEIVQYEIYFDENEHPFFSKITEDHYTVKDVLTSHQFFINLPKSSMELEKIYFSNSETHKTIIKIFEIVKGYEKR